MSGRAILGIIRVTTPVNDRGAFLHTFPPGLVVCSQCNISKYRIVLDGRVCIWVGLEIGAWCNAEIACFRIDGTHLPITAHIEPANVITHCPDLPARNIAGRDQHGEVGLAAGRRECSSYVTGFTSRILDTHDQHVFSQPAFGAGLIAGNT